MRCGVRKGRGGGHDDLLGLLLVLVQVLGAKKPRLPPDNSVPKGRSQNFGVVPFHIFQCSQQTALMAWLDLQCGWPKVMWQVLHGKSRTMGNMSSRIITGLRLLALERGAQGEHTYGTYKAYTAVHLIV